MRGRNLGILILLCLVMIGFAHQSLLHKARLAKPNPSRAVAALPPTTGATDGETFFFQTMQALNLHSSIPLKREHSLPPGFGTAHARPRYNPFGPIQTAFLDGAIDAYNLGFQTLKIWNGPELKDSSFYFLSAEEREHSISTPKAALDIPVFQAVLSIPFKTIVFETDDVAIWNKMESVAMSQEDENRIYRNTYDFAAELLNRYKGKNRTFIIQNHEGDWHIVPPAAAGLDNYKRYWSARQKAIEDARRDHPSDVKVYQLCEVVRVRPSLEQNQPSLARDVLPSVACDLVGYSAYESALDPKGRETLTAALNYLRSVARPSPTFGSNQVVISEIGIPELESYSATQQSLVASIIREQLSQGMPYVLFWTLYDNECTLPACKVSDGVQSNVDLSHLRGFFVRRPDRQLGNVFQQILNPSAIPSSAPTSSSGPREDWIRALYIDGLGREPDATGFAFWKNAALSAKSVSDCKTIVRDFFLKDSAFISKLNSTAPSQVVQLGYQTVLRRSTDSSGFNYGSDLITRGKITRSQFIDSLIDSGETTEACKRLGFI